MWISLISLTAATIFFPQRCVWKSKTFTQRVWRIFCTGIVHSKSYQLPQAPVDKNMLIKSLFYKRDFQKTYVPPGAPFLVSARKGGKNRFKRGLFTSRPLLKITPPECSGEAVLPRRKCKRFPPCRIREGNRFYTQSTNRRPIGRFYSPVKSARSEVPHWPRASPGTPSAN